MDVRQHLLTLFDAGVAAVSAEACLATHLPCDVPRGRTVLIAVGKAAGAMAQVAARTLAIDAGLVITRYGHMPPDWDVPDQFRVIEAGHPAPDAASLRAGAAALELAQGLGDGDRLIMLVSGGGSALMAAPAEGVDFAAKQALTRKLLASGAPIAAINQVRSALSRIKGGRLAQAAAPADVLTYVISDVPGDDPALVASGPTLATAWADAPLAVLRRYAIAVPNALQAALSAPAPPIAIAGPTRICARAADALAAIADQAAALGYHPHLLGDALEGDAAKLAAAHANLALAARRSGTPTALISGGEASVRVNNPAGRGGRNTTYALALALALDGAPGIAACAGDSDGIDGISDAAGALVFPDTLARIAAAGLDAAHLLRTNDSDAAFAAIGDRIVTGPTRTNVNDLRVILVDGAPPR
jgi:glycerate 2-kinase